MALTLQRLWGKLPNLTKCTAAILMMGMGLAACSAASREPSSHAGAEPIPSSALEITQRDNQTDSDHRDNKEQSKIIDDIALASQRWQQQPSHYSFVAAQHCYCLPNARAPRLITVNQDSITQIFYLESGEADPAPPAILQKTITEWFHYLRDQSQQEHATVNGSFAAVTGFPVRVYIDRHPRIADDEFSVEFSQYKPLPTP